ncbi:hydrogenase maturation protease [Hahella ganghwensis]|uniref:hydrogenase maturation protease n=1 Tax=Hahella ganghwensis TaxID=286420 RepID=UPI000367DB58|nr:hydrogenase maturation protease [Hahella ganghwensis]
MSSSSDKSAQNEMISHESNGQTQRVLDVNRAKTLIIGYGNPGRQDDGLGPEFVRRVDTDSWLDVVTQVNYQLTVEDAVDIANFERVIFVDAALGAARNGVDAGSGYSFSAVSSAVAQPFASHSLTPEGLMALSQTLFQASAVAYILAIDGYEFDQFEEKLSPAAERNLHEALCYCRHWLQAHPLEGRVEHA